jgi:rhodanese-related sulfurtransferase
MTTLKPFLFLILFTAAFTSCKQEGETKKATRIPDATSVMPDSESRKTLIVDVRTREEWDNDGHAACTVNYPLDELDSKIETMRGYDEIILVCRSGSRAGYAKEMLDQAGFKSVINKGAWQNITCDK